MRLRAIFDDLQGHWEDDVGNEIEVSGDTALFSDGSGAWPISETANGLELRGTRLISSPDKPLWQFPNGVLRRWIRPTPVAPEDTEWEEVFHQCKAELLTIRRQLWASVSMEDFAEASALRDSWDAGGTLPQNCSLEQQARLAAGRRLVTGVCFVHRKFNYRGVIVACEPWCNASSAWRERMGVATLPRGETQPFYHCLVDDRDRPGGTATFVSEENIVPDASSFSVQNWLVDALLVPCKELGGYLPSPRLDVALQQQRRRGRFNWDFRSITEDEV